MDDIKTHVNEEMLKHWSIAADLGVVNRRKKDPEPLVLEVKKPLSIMRPPKRANSQRD
jgi:hypothetical protein